MLHGLGKLLFYALDYNVPVDEERGDLPELLEDFLDRLIENEETNDPKILEQQVLSSDEDNAPDEGFDAGPDDIMKPGDEHGPIKSFSQVLRVLEGFLMVDCLIFLIFTIVAGLLLISYKFPKS